MNRQTEENLVRVVYGNGQPGLKTQVEMLWEDHEERKMEKKEARAFRWTMTGSLIVLLVDRFVHWFGK